MESNIARDVFGKDDISNRGKWSCAKDTFQELFKEELLWMSSRR